MFTSYRIKLNYIALSLASMLVINYVARAGVGLYDWRGNAMMKL